MKTIKKKRKNARPIFLILAVIFLLLIFYSKFPRMLTRVGQTYSDQCKRTEEGRLLPELASEDRKYLAGLAYDAARDYFAGKEVRPAFPEKFGGACNEVYAVFRVDGRLKGSASALRKNLADSVYSAVGKALKEGRCEGTLKCSGNLTRSELGKLQIEVFILDGGREVSDRGKLYLPRLKVFDGEFEPGIHTIRLEKGSKSATYLSDVAIVGNIDTPKLVSALCNKINLSDDCAKRKDVSVTVYETTHFMKNAKEERVIDLYRANSLVGFGDITISRVNESLRQMNGWLTRNLNKEGYFTYKYYLGNGEYSKANNVIRQLMASRILAELSWNDTEIAKLHKRNLDYVFSNWYIEEGDLGYILQANKSKLGATATAVRTLVYSPYFDNYSVQAGKLANTILALQHEDGSFDPWYIEPDYEYDEDRLLTYYSGEAILGLVEYYQKTGDERILAAAVKSEDYYIGEYVDRMSENYYPAYVPWHSMSLYKLYRVTGDRKYVDASFRLNDELIKIQQIERPRYIDIWGRFFNPKHPEFGYPHASSAGVYLEGLTYAYELAREVNDTERVKTYGRSIRLGALNVVNLQCREDNVYYLGHPERVLGAIRADVLQNYIQVDTTQHNSDAFTRIVKVFSEEEIESYNE
jgi:AMMECR1 domain-containing protein